MGVITEMPGAIGRGYFYGSDCWRTNKAAEYEHGFPRI